MSRDDLPDRPHGARGRPPTFRAGDGNGSVPVQARAWPADRGPAPEDEIGLDEIFAVLRRRWRAVAAVFLLVVGAAAFYTWWKTPVWEASSVIRVEEQSRSGGSQAAERLMLQLGPTSEVATEMRVVETHPVLAQVVEDLDLTFRLASPGGLPRDLVFAHVDFGEPVPEGTYRIERTGDRYRLRQTEPDTARLEREFAAGDTVSLPGGRFVVAGPGALPEVEGDPPSGLEVRTVPFHRAVRDLEETLSVARPDPDASLIRVRYKGTDRHLVRRVPNAVADAFLARRREVQTTEARSTVAFLEDQTARLEKQLEAAEEELQRFREEEQVVAPAAEAEAQVQRLTELRARRSELAAERDALQNLLQTIRSGAGEPDYRKLVAFPTFLRNQGVQDLLASLSEAERQRTEMLNRRTERHPDVVALTEQIEQMESRLGEIGRNYLGSLNDQIASIDAVLSRFSSELEEVPATEVQYARLQRRTDMLTEIHTLLQTRLEEAQISANVEDPSVRVVESAVLPHEPIAPRPVRNLALAGFLGLMMGVGLAFVREFTDRRIHDEDDVERALDGMPILTRVPRVPEADEKYPRHQGLVAADGRSLPAESYRTLRTNVRYTRGGQGSRELVVTSPGARDGKSMTASNLAVTFAQQGHRTLLIDADMRRSVQHEAFEVEQSPGLSDLLVDGQPAEKLEQVVRATAVENLDLLTGGHPPPNPAELLDSPAMERLLEQARETYDAVVVDTPPALVVTDASVLGAKVEGVLMVIRADQTDRHAAEDAMQQLQRVGCDVLGVVFNDADGGSGGYRYDYYYRYYGENGERGGARERWKRLLPFG